MIVEEDKNLSANQIQTLADLITAHKNFDGQINKAIPQAEGGSRDMSWAAKAARYLPWGSDSSVARSATILEAMDDIKFLNLVATTAEARPVYVEAAAEIKAEAYKCLKEKLRRICGQWVKSIKEMLYQQVETALDRSFTELQREEDAAAWNTLRLMLQKRLHSSDGDSKYVFLPLSVGALTLWSFA